jgi:hypothetical protein
MTRTFQGAAAAALLLIASSAGAQEPVRWANPDRALAEADSFGFNVNGQQLGVQVVRFARMDGGLHFEETTTLPMASQATTVHMSDALAMGTVRQSGQAQGQPMSIEVDYGVERATGIALTPMAPDTVPIDAEIVAGTIDDNVLISLLPAIDWSAATDVVVPVFHSGQNTAANVRMRVTGTESVTVPAGTFETFRVETSGDRVPLVVSVESAAPHRVVRVQIVGAPVEIVRLN